MEDDENGVGIGIGVGIGVGNGIGNDGARKPPARRAFVAADGETTDVRPMATDSIITASGKKMRRGCLNCQAQKTPQWRMGPEGPKTLCNACGVRYRKGLPMDGV
jgi:hypothetical protein